MRRRGTHERARRWVCGAGPGHVAILRGQDANGTAGARRTRGGWARVQVGVAGLVGRLTDWFDLWVQVMDEWIHHPR
jgi:hypothetical protein